LPLGFTRGGLLLPGQVAGRVPSLLSRFLLGHAGSVGLSSLVGSHPIGLSFACNLGRIHVGVAARIRQPAATVSPRLVGIGGAGQLIRLSHLAGRIGPFQYRIPFTGRLVRIACVTTSRIGSFGCRPAFFCSRRPFVFLLLPFELGCGLVGSKLLASIDFGQSQFLRTSPLLASLVSGSQHRVNIRCGLASPGLGEFAFGPTFCGSLFGSEPFGGTALASNFLNRLAAFLIVAALILSQLPEGIAAIRPAGRGLYPAF
jgi:hypothetical protein